MGLIEVLIILGISIGSGVAVVEYQKARQDPPPFQSHTDAPTFSGEIKIEPMEGEEV